jgi:hypothetical protein
MTNNAPATIRIIMVESIVNSPFDRQHVDTFRRRSRRGAKAGAEAAGSTRLQDCEAGRRRSRSFTAPPATVHFGLLDPGATALDQNDQHDDKQHAGNDPDNHGCVQGYSPFQQRHFSIASPAGAGRERHPPPKRRGALVCGTAKPASGNWCNSTSSPPDPRNPG